MSQKKVVVEWNGHLTCCQDNGMLRPCLTKDWADEERACKGCPIQAILQAYCSFWDEIENVEPFYPSPLSDYGL